MEKIMVIDDAADNVKLLTYDLEDMGYEVVSAPSGYEALELLPKELPDCILLDLIMPGMSGFDVCEKIKNDPQYHDIPIVIVSARNSDKDLVVGLQLGADDYVTKPINTTILSARIESALRTGTVKSKLRELNQSIEKARQEAEAANKAKSEFLSNMSHEIRTPMTSILGYADILLSSVKDSEELAAVKTIKKNGEYLIDLINDILDLSKIESQKLEIEIISFSPVQILSEVASLMRVRSAAKGLSLEIHFEGDIPERIQSDPTRVRQVLINLVGNAIKFTEMGTIKIVCKTINSQGDSPKMQFKIIDEGIGMSPEQQCKLFQPFVQADTSISRKFGGTGLGLTISKRLTALLHGQINFESELEKGTTFWFTIPTGPLKNIRMLECPSEIAQENNSDLLDKLNLEELENRHFLLAEDGPDNQRLISHVLKKYGVKTTIVENGKDALESALSAEENGTSYDLILMDMQMPEMDGFTATRKLRQAGYTKPIIALTAHAMSGSRNKCIQSGCDDYVSKPINFKKLAQTIMYYLPATVEQ